MSRNQTDVERKLWWRLRTLKRDGFHFRRQVPIDHLIVDFACYSARLVVEVDGGQHNWDEGVGRIAHEMRTSVAKVSARAPVLEQ
ncbi:MAG TPA: DUF559 domain-containing protein [Pseudolabrys sp.]|nr:DUF559 domain-containing protein [Pseudolabrys sp.]